jgi:hypothetical protein
MSGEISTMKKGRVLVQPTTPRMGSRFEDVSPLDQAMYRAILPIMYFFRVESSGLRLKILHCLEKGLACTIDEMPFIMANIVSKSEQTGTVQLEYGQDQGVWFMWQELPAFDFSKLAVSDFRLSPSISDHLVPEPREHLDSGSPVLTVLVSFITGGVVLTLNFHHLAMDASGFCSLMDVYVRNIAAASNYHIAPRIEKTSAEALDRVTPFLFTQNSLRAASAASLNPELSYPVAMERDVQLQRREQGLLLKESRWLLSKQSLASLKAITAEFSVNTIIAAMIWRHVSLARNLSSQGIETTSIVTPVCVRKLLGLPAKYVGNAVLPAHTVASTAELESRDFNELETLEKLCQRISDSIRWWTLDRIQQYVTSLANSADVRYQLLVKDFALSVTAPPAISNKLSWGNELGLLAATNVVYPSRMYDGMVGIMAYDDDKRTVLFWTDPVVHERLLADKEWTLYFQPAESQRTSKL